MTFTLSGSVITQTGTDADLSGLASITGVTALTSGWRTTYNLGTLTLIISGTLSQDPDVEELTFAATGAVPCLTISSDGEFYYGTETIIGGKPLRSSGTGLIFTGVDTTSSAEWDMGGYAAILVNGGKLVTRGGRIVSSRGLGFYNTPLIDMEGTILSKRGTASRREVRSDGQGSVTLGFRTGSRMHTILDGFQLSFRSLPSEFSAEILDAEVVQLSKGGDATLRDLDTSQNVAAQDLGTDSDGGVKSFTAVNPSAGSDLRMMPKSGVGLKRQNGILIVSQEIDFDVRDAAGAALSGVKIFCRDVNSGYRTDRLGLDDTPDKTYSATTSAQGLATIPSLVLAITKIVATAAFSPSDWDTSANSDAYRVDRRGAAGDVFAFGFASYAQALAQASIACRGTGGTHILWTLFADASITEPDKAVTDALTSIDSAAQFYDRAKAHLYDVYDGETETLVTRSGDVVTTTYDVIVDASAPAVFAFDGSTITIKASEYVGGISTTGTVITANGAVVNGLIQDVSRDAVLTERSGLPFTAYATAADREARTNPVVSDTTAWSGLSSTTQALYCVVKFGDAYIYADAQIQPGENEIDVGVNGQLAAMRASMLTEAESDELLQHARANRARLAQGKSI